MRRRKTRTVDVGGVKVGWGNPVRIQSMAKADTRDTKKVIAEIRRLEKAGCEIARVAVKDMEAAGAIKSIKKKINIPLVADIHFDYRLALESIKNGADKIRVNPGNISKPGHLKEIIRAAKKRNLPIRLGLNSGSLFPDRGGQEFLTGAVRKAVGWIGVFEKEGFRDIIVSVKSSDVEETVRAYRRLARICDYPFHLGVTAAGSYDSGIVKSSIGIGALLLDGIGDTIRVSLTGDPVEEVIAAKRILQSLKLRSFGPDIISCPTCGRCQVDLGKIVKELEKEICLVRGGLLMGTASAGTACSSGSIVSGRRLSPLESTSGVERLPLTVAIMGCEVNGPGEAKEADIGIAFGKDSGLLFRKGKIVKKVKARDSVKELLKLCAGRRR